MKIRGSFSMEYAMVIALIAAACMGMFSYMQHALSGRFRQVGDTFGHGRQYAQEDGPCGAGQVLCWRVTRSGAYQADRWSKKDRCATGNKDKCDPWHHCWSGVSFPIGGIAGNPCGKDGVGYGTSIDAARQSATSDLIGKCSNCGYKLPSDTGEQGPGGGSCNCCPDTGEDTTALTSFLCIAEISATQICSDRCS